MAESFLAKFTADDLRALRAVIVEYHRKRGKALNNRPVRDHVSDDQLWTPEVYVALAPDGGIPARAEYDTGTVNDDVPGSAECDVFELQYGDVFARIGIAVLVYNVFAVDVPAGSWVLIARDKHGRWWVTSPVPCAGECTDYYTWKSLVDGDTYTHPTAGLGIYPVDGTVAATNGSVIPPTMMFLPPNSDLLVEMQIACSLSNGAAMYPNDYGVIGDSLGVAVATSPKSLGVYVCPVHVYSDGTYHSALGLVQSTNVCVGQAVMITGRPDLAGLARMQTYMFPNYVGDADQSRWLFRVTTGSVGYWIAHSAVNADALLADSGTGNRFFVAKVHGIGLGLTWAKWKAVCHSCAPLTPVVESTDTGTGTGTGVTPGEEFFTTAGAVSWVVQAETYTVHCWGAGAGGEGGSSGIGNGGKGGGGGGYARKSYTGATVGVTVNGVVGAGGVGGVGGAVGAEGDNGAATTWDGGLALSADGGRSSGTGGGTSSLGDVTFSGGDGGSSGINPGGSGGGGSGGTTAVGSNGSGAVDNSGAAGGAGGAASGGDGGTGKNKTGTGGTPAAEQPGGGGGGGGGNGNDGLAGADGMIWVTWP